MFCYHNRFPRSKYKTKRKRSISHSFRTHVSSLGWNFPYIPKIFQSSFCCNWPTFDWYRVGSKQSNCWFDRKKALVKAIKSSFCEAKLTLCTRHLEENLKRQLKNKIGMPDKESKQIGNEIFGTDGLISLDTTVSFAEKACDLERKYKDKVGPYLTEKLIPTIKEHVFKIYKSDTRLPLSWKNNHCEAMNHILKLNLNSKPAKIPELIKMLHREISLQEALIRGAFMVMVIMNFLLKHPVWEFH